MGRMRKSEGLEIAWAEKGSFPVRLSEDLFNVENPTVAETLRAATGSDRPRVMLIADMNVVQRTEGLGTRIGKYVQTHGIELAGAPLVLSGGEKIKTDSCQSVHRIVNAAIAAKVGVTDVMMVLGGGSLLDVAGVAARQVRGGIRIVRVPTTVAAMVDTALAGTAAVNVPEAKDVVRVTSHPAAVLIDTGFARTVLDGVWRAGLGEIIRQAAVLDGALLKRVARNAEALRDRSTRLMADAVRDVVTARVKKGETGFALWSALRLEAMSGYKLPHGYAVPIAVCIDAAYAVVKGLLTEDEQDLLGKALSECGALDGLVHSRYLLGQSEAILKGLDAWRLDTGSAAIPLPGGLGKLAMDESPDRAAYQKVIKTFLAVSSEA